MLTAIELLSEKRFDDVALLIIISMMIDVINEHKHHTDYSRLVDSLDYWERQIEGYGPGVIRLELEEVLREQIARDAFVSVLRQGRAKLELFVDVVPLDFINRLVMFSIFVRTKHPGIEIRKPLPVGPLLKVVENLEELIAA